MLYLKMENENSEAYERNWSKIEKQITNSWNASKLGSQRVGVWAGMPATKGTARRHRTLLGS